MTLITEEALFRVGSFEEGTGEDTTRRKCDWLLGSTDELYSQLNRPVPTSLFNRERDLKFVIG